jgi:hypothetical protein
MALPWWSLRGPGRHGNAAATPGGDHRGAPGSRPVKGRGDRGGAWGQCRRSWPQTIEEYADRHSASAEQPSDPRPDSIAGPN